MLHSVNDEKNSPVYFKSTEFGFLGQIRTNIQ